MKYKRFVDELFFVLFLLKTSTATARVKSHLPTGYYKPIVAPLRSMTDAFSTRFEFFKILIKVLWNFALIQAFLLFAVRRNQPAPSILSFVAHFSSEAFQST